MKTVPKNKKMGVKDWYYSLPANKQAVYRQKIIDTCEYSRNKFYRVINGDSTPTTLERQAIDKIAGESLDYNIQLPVLSS